MKTTPIIVCSILATFATSCTTQNIEQNSCKTQHEIQLRTERELIQDENFVLYFDEDPDKCTFHEKHNEATMAQLANFAMQTCWQQKLAPKFGKGQKDKLTDNDVKLAEFCLDAHFMFLDTLTVAMLNDLTQNDAIVNEYVNVKSSRRLKLNDSMTHEQFERLKEEIDDTYDTLKENFLCSTNIPLRNCIRNWGRSFAQENVQSANWVSVYSGIYNQMPCVDTDKLRDEYESWLWMPSVVAESGDATMLDLSQPKNGVSTCEAAESWSVMEKSVRRYLDSMNDMYSSIEAKHANLSLDDSGVVEKCQRLMEKKGANVRAYNRYFRGALYDMPLTFYSCRGYAGVYQNAHWWNDDEEKMYEAAKYMVMGIRGIEMISNAQSPYAVDAYNQTVDYLKYKLSDAEFKTLQTNTKMYHVDIDRKDGAGRNMLMDPMNPEQPAKLDN